MKVTLEDLKKGKGKVNLKEFKFLTPLMKILEKDHGKDILNSDSLTEELLTEAIDASTKNKILAVYHSPENLILGNFGYVRHFYKDRGDEKLTVFDSYLSMRNTKDIMEGTGYPNLVFNLWSYSRNSNILLKDIYVVTDEKALEEYRFELMLEAEAKEKAELEKRGEEKRVKISKDKELMVKYNLTENSLHNSRTYIDILEALESDSPECRLEGIRTMFEEVEEIAENYGY